MEKGISNNSSYGIWYYIPGREECKSWVCLQTLAQVQWRTFCAGFSCSIPACWKSVSAIVLQSSLAMKSSSRATDKACYKVPLGYWELIFFPQSTGMSLPSQVPARGTEIRGVNFGSKDWGCSVESALLFLDRLLVTVRNQSKLFRSGK